MQAINISDAVQASLAQIMADPDLVNPCEDADVSAWPHHA